MLPYFSINQKGFLLLFFLLVSFRSLPAETETIYVARATVVGAQYCPSGVALRFSNAARCIAKTEKIPLGSLVSSNVKISYKPHGSIKHDGKKEDVFEIVALDPPQEAGTSYQHEKPKGFWGTTIDVLNATATEYNRQHGYPTPDVAQPAPTISSNSSVPSTVSKGSTYNPNECIPISTVTIISQAGTELGHCTGETRISVRNNSSEAAYCQVAFHQRGYYQWPSASGFTLRGGEFVPASSLVGYFDCSTDNTSIKYRCWSKQDEDTHSCLAKYPFREPTN